MPKSCPDCSRPNGDAAVRCLYCGAALPLPETLPNSSESAETWPDGYTIVLLGRGAPPDPARFQAATGRPQTWLDGGAPICVETFTDLDQAMALHGEMRAAGLDCTVVADARLGDPGPTFHARRATWTPSGPVYETADGHRCQLSFADVVLITRALASDANPAEDPNRLRSRSMSGRVISSLAGGAQRGLVCEIFGTATPPVRVVGDSFDYSVLGPDRGPLATDNFDRLLEALSGRCPGARFDDSFNRLDKAEALNSRRSEMDRLAIYGRRLYLALAQGD